MNEDLQTVYDYFKRKYPENNIIISGYSLGTGPASLLAANNHPKMLILNAPYYSMVDFSWGVVVCRGTGIMVPVQTLVNHFNGVSTAFQ